MLNNSISQGQGHKITFQMMLDARVWISNSVLKAGMMKNVDKAGKLKDVDEAGEPIKGRGEKKSKKKSKLHPTNIEKSSNQVVPTMEEQQTVELMDELLSTKSPKPVSLR